MVIYALPLPVRLTLILRLACRPHYIYATRHGVETISGRACPIAVWNGYTMSLGRPVRTGHYLGTCLSLPFGLCIWHL